MADTITTSAILSYRAIADELAARGIATRAGRPWSAKALRSIVQRNAA